MNITESRDEAFEAIAEMLRSNVKKTKIASQLAADYCVSDKTVYKWITRVEEMYDIERFYGTNVVFIRVRTGTNSYKQTCYFSMFLLP